MTTMLRPMDNVRYIGRNTDISAETSKKIGVIDSFVQKTGKFVVNFEGVGYIVSPSSLKFVPADQVEKKYLSSDDINQHRADVIKKVQKSNADRRKRDETDI